MKKISFLMLIILLFSLSYCNKGHNNNLHPFQNIENYNGNVNLPVAERLLDTPDIIIGFLNGLDNVDYYSSYKLNTDEIRLFMEYYNLLPIKYKEIIKEKVIGIYFINKFLSGGMTLPIFDKNDNMYMVLFFNPEILSKNISEWINFRDNSVFINNENNISLSIECYNNYYALIHTLTHETSHVYDYYNFITPYTEIFLKNNQTIFPTDFVNGVWNDYDKPIEEYEYLNRENISFYDLGERINKNFALGIYSALKYTPFNSLYGSKTWAEDFAESFTWYYLKKYYEIEYITILKNDENNIMIYNPNENELVKRRYEIFEEIIKSTTSP